MLRANLSLVPKQDAEPGTEPDTVSPPLPVAANNLPIPPTPLIGREQEAASATGLLRREDIRLLSFVGPGGVGKTRLALRVAQELLGDFADGVYFVGLAHIADAGLAISAIAQALGVKEATGQAMLTLLRAYLRDRRVLLLLDNFEHVVSAGPSITELLAACPDLKVIVTSRAVLQLRGEHEFLVPPLELPSIEKAADIEALARCAAVALFVQRAKSVKPDFQVSAANIHALAQICRRLDGLPLAIELVAARTKLLPPQALLARLVGAHGISLRSTASLLTGGAQDLPARQQTMRATMEWSYGLLTPAEQKLFRRIAVFAGGCAVEAAETVCDVGGRVRELGESEEGNSNSPSPYSLTPLGMDVLDGIGSLVNKSLLRQVESDGQEPRLVMLETIREYALEHLMLSEESEAVQRQHALYFLQLAEQSEAELRGPGQVPWLERLEAEHDNFRAALKWSMDADDVDDVELGLRLAGALGRSGV